MRRYLVVANQTLGESLLARVQGCLDAAQCQFRLVVPITHAPARADWTEGPDRAVNRAAA